MTRFSLACLSREEHIHHGICLKSISLPPSLSLSLVIPRRSNYLAAVRDVCVNIASRIFHYSPGEPHHTYREISSVPRTVLHPAEQDVAPQQRVPSERTECVVIRDGFRVDNNEDKPPQEKRPNLILEGRRPRVSSLIVRATILGRPTFLQRDLQGGRERRVFASSTPRLDKRGPPPHPHG